jgi:hypothetical protein
MNLYNTPHYRPPFYQFRNTPAYCPCLEGTGPQYIKQCLNMYVYVWTVSKKSFWMYPVKIEKGILYGYIHNGITWRYVKLNINQIDCIY